MRNKYFIKEGNEELQKALLLMKYDSKKTLSENIQETEVNEIAPVVAALAAVPAWIWGSAAGVAGVTAIGAWISDVMGGSNAAKKTEKFFQGCSTHNKNLKSTVSKATIRSAADSIYEAINGVGTDEGAIKTALQTMPTPGDLCAMANYYEATYANSIYSDIDGDIDGQDWVTYIWSAINPQLLDAEEELENAEKGEQGQKETPKPNETPKQTQKPNEQVKQIQEMLVGLGYYIGNSGPSKNGVDGYYGKKTDAAYKAWQSKESAQDFNNRVYKIGKTATTQGTTTQQGTTNQGAATQQGTTNQGAATQQGTTTQQGGTQQGTTTQGVTTQQSSGDREINIVNPDEF